MQRPARIPFYLQLAGITFAAMLLPAAFALSIEDFHDARSFFYPGILGLVMVYVVHLALANRRQPESAMGHLIALLAAYLTLPAVMAVPFYEAVRNTSFLSAYFEMLSSLTTTGATMFDATRLSGPEHLWRAQVGWLGGLLIWVAAGAIMAPLTVGGFEVTARGEPGQMVEAGALRATRITPDKRLARSFKELFPIYTGLTIAVTLMLLLAGDPPLVALSHAMSTLSTSGISPLGGVEGAVSGRTGEMILFCFFFFALSRLTFSTDTGRTAGSVPGLINDPEFRLGVIITLLVPAAIFFRHWAGAFDVGDEQNILTGLQAFWGGLFTSLSFLSTTGFISADWDTAQAWSGLPTPGIILMALSLMGGGVATTAGGVKLLRVFALYLNGAREIERLVYPSSVGRTRTRARRIRREGAFIAWVSFMLFAVTLAGCTVALALFGTSFENAIVLSIASLANAGPLLTWAVETPIDLIALEPAAKLLICGSMVLGRLELLAIIVMLSPEIWRG